MLSSSSHSNKGKPSLKGIPDIHFSLSHCCHAVVCAVNNHPVGIDIDSLDPIDDSIVSSVMSKKEKLQIAAAERIDIAFCHQWTMKESLYKLTGNDNGGEIKHMLEKAPPVTFETSVYPQHLRCLPPQNLIQKPNVNNCIGI